MRILSLTSFAVFATYVSAAKFCPEDPPASCSEQSNGMDSCCIPSPGLFELSQIWDVKHKRWIIDSIRILSCDGLKEHTSCDSSRVYPPSKVQNLVEGYARHAIPLVEVSRELGWGGISLDARDEQVAEIWAQQWATHGTCISTFDTKCFDKDMPLGEEEAWNDPGPALFVQTMHQLHHSLTKQAEPLPHEPHQIRQRISSLGSPYHGPETLVLCEA
ncbi:hypothetical protein BDV93DRAFT_521882 [Ceratobasidium sp. AG-I]|nr:hypothetical protein BDV93DRAFT_521882 [Ceratobasidium sp. AG-I]